MVHVRGGLDLDGPEIRLHCRFRLLDRSEARALPSHGAGASITLAPDPFAGDALREWARNLEGAQAAGIGSK